MSWAFKPKAEYWVVDFWASWCRPCIDGIGYFNRLAPSFPREQVRFIGINIDANESDWLLMIDRFKLAYPQLHWPDHSKDPYILRNFPFKYIPAIFVISPEGKVKRMKDWWKVDHYLQKSFRK